MTALPAPLLLRAPGGTGEVHVQGAHLTDWTPTGMPAVLWTSAFARFEAGVAIRGGVPIVFPWFGGGGSGDLSPAHGFARTSGWRHVGTHAEGDDVIAAFTLDTATASAPSFPFRYSCRYEVRLGSSLAVRLTVRNEDDRMLSFEEALHVYLSVGDVREVRVEGLAGARYLDQVAVGGPRVEVQEGDVTFTEETDRIYASSRSVRVVDPVLGRVLVIDKHNSASTVVWNPWSCKAAALADFGDDEWPSMLCIEGGNLRTAAVDLAPGQTHEMGYAITVECLS